MSIKLQFQAAPLENGLQTSTKRLHTARKTAAESAGGTRRHKCARVKTRAFAGYARPHLSRPSCVSDWNRGRATMTDGACLQRVAGPPILIQHYQNRESHSINALVRKLPAAPLTGLAAREKPEGARGTPARLQTRVNNGGRPQPSNALHVIPGFCRFRLEPWLC